MLTIRKKFILLLGVVFIGGAVIFNLVLNKVFYEGFKSSITKNMEDNYRVSIKNFDDYIAFNSLSRETLKESDINSKAIKFIVDRVSCRGVFFSLDGKVLATGSPSLEEVDLGEITKLPNSFEKAKDNNTVIDIENSKGRVLAKLSYLIYGEGNEKIGVLVLIKDYTELYLNNENTKKIVYVVAFSVFSILLILIYILLSRLIKPLSLLKEGAENLANGKYPKEIMVKTKDEIGVLSLAFNNMNLSLQKKERQEKDLFRNITHELKTPLSAIGGYAQVLRGDGFDDEEFKNKALDRIISESKRMNEMVVALLSIGQQNSDLEEYAYTKVELERLLEKILLGEEIKIKEKGLRLEKNTEEVLVLGNLFYLRILLSNLISNGIKYSNRESKIEITLRKEENLCRFSIKTVGEEIPLDFKEKIFEAFVRVKKEGFASKESNGLGLYIAKNIVEAHGGEIWVEALGEVSIFYFTLPLA